MKNSTATGVCIVVENLPVPLDRRVWKEACALRDAGYRVSVICPKGKGYKAGFESLDGIEIYRHITCEAAAKWSYILEYGVAMLAELYFVLRVFYRTRFRILQACNPPDTIFLIGLLLRPLGVRFIFDQHDLGPELFEAKFGGRNGLLYKLSRFCEWASFWSASSCIVTNESFRDLAIARGGVGLEKVFVVQNCPDISTFRRQLPGVNAKFGKQLLVAYVGFMGTQDGLSLLLESIEHIIKRQGRVDTHFLLIGGGSMLAEIQRQIAAKGIENFVSLTGQVSHDQVASYLSSADIGVAPDPKNALNDNLTMVKILEYMAFGLPVVLFDLKQGRRIAGAAALYAVPNDPMDFASQITRLLDSQELRRQLGDWGEEQIKKRLNWDAERSHLLRAYEAALFTKPSLVPRASD